VQQRAGQSLSAQDHYKILQAFSRKDELPFDDINIFRSN
jgi:hypothetical protein